MWGGIIGLIIQLISGAVGGNIAGSAMKQYSLGTIGNSIAGLIGGGDSREQRGELAKITERHKFYKDFDSITTRDYVLYADALSGNTYDEVEHHYIDIIRFQALQIALNHWGNWDIMPPTNDAELGDPSVAHRREGHQEQPAESPPPVPTQTQGASYPGQTDDPNPNALPRKPDIKAAS